MTMMCGLSCPMLNFKLVNLFLSESELAENILRLLFSTALLCFMPLLVLVGERDVEVVCTGTLGCE